MKLAKRESAVLANDAPPECVQFHLYLLCLLAVSGLIFVAGLMLIVEVYNINCLVG